jgi:uncharacterized protein YycO
MLKRIKAWILSSTIPLQKWVQQQGRLETVITKSIVDRIQMLAQPGDILLSYEAQRWTSRLIKGFYDHATIVSSRGSVVEAVGDLYKRHPRARWWHLRGEWIRNEDGSKMNFGGVREVPLEEWLYKKDYVAVIRVDHASAHIAGMNALKYVGKGYDYKFSHDNEEVYCSELPYLSFRTDWKEFLIEVPDNKEILPQMYYDLCGILKYLKCLIDTKSM